MMLGFGKDDQQDKAQVVKSPVWEHKTIETKNHITFVADAEALGKEGWELVHIQYVLDGIVVIGYFKRLVTDTICPT